LRSRLSSIGGDRDSTGSNFAAALLDEAWSHIRAGAFADAAAALETAQTALRINNVQVGNQAFAGGSRRNGDFARKMRYA
jgi:hypothetical protein